MLFADRVDAGRQLAARLTSVQFKAPVVLGLPRGGVPVAFEVARQLQAPLDVVVVRKLGLPQHRELAMGALGEGGVVVVNDDVVAHAGVSDAQFTAVQDEEQAELDRRVTRLRGGRARSPLAGRTAILVDDGTLEIMRSCRPRCARRKCSANHNCATISAVVKFRLKP